MMELQQLHRIGSLILHNRVTASIVGIENKGQPNGDWLPTSSGSRAAMGLFPQKNVLVFLRLFESYYKKKQLCRRIFFNSSLFSFRKLNLKIHQKRSFLFSSLFSHKRA
jgi:hypothetical protein